MLEHIRFKTFALEVLLKVHKIKNALFIQYHGSFHAYIHTHTQSRVVVPPTSLLMDVWSKLNMNKHTYAKLNIIMVCLESHSGEDREKMTNSLGSLVQDALESTVYLNAMAAKTGPDWYSNICLNQ